MNFYKHHLGDYDGATAHLSWDEDLAYRRLLNVYYRLEAPIPKDPGATYRLVRALTKSQKEAVTSVLHEFFEERDDGWHNQRCDEEILAYRAQCETNRIVGRLGGRPRKTESVISRNRIETEVGTENNPNHEPLTTNHKPEEAKSIVRLAPDLRQQAREVLKFLNDKTGRHYEAVPATLDPILARLKGGSSVEDLRAVIAKKTREWGADEKMQKYLRPKTLFNATNFANYKGELEAA